MNNSLLARWSTFTQAFQAQGDLDSEHLEGWSPGAGAAGGCVQRALGIGASPAPRLSSQTPSPLTDTVWDRYCWEPWLLCSASACVRVGAWARSAPGFCVLWQFLPPFVATSSAKSSQQPPFNENHEGVFHHWRNTFVCFSIKCWRFCLFLLVCLFVSPTFLSEFIGYSWVLFLKLFCAAATTAFFHAYFHLGAGVLKEDVSTLQHAVIWQQWQW